MTSPAPRGDPLLTVAGPLTGQVWAGSGAPQPVLVANLSTTATAYVGYNNSISPTGLNVVPIGPQQAFAFDGSRTLYAVALTQIPLLVLPNATQYFSGNISITNSNLNVTVTGGSVNATVSGSVSITGTPSVSISGTPTVSIGGTPNVKITGQSVSLDVSAATVNINPAAGFILPGQTVNIYSNTTSTNIGPGVLTGFAQLIDISKYQSVDFKINVFAASQATTGSALVADVQILWFDDAIGSNVVYAEGVCCYAGNGSGNQQALSGTVPARGHYLSVSIQNLGTAGNLTVTNVTLTGSFRTPVNSSWRQLLGGLVIGGTTVMNNGVTQVQFSNNLLTLPNTTPGSTGIRVWMIPLFAGPAYVRWALGATVLVNVPTIIDAAYATSGNVVGGNGQAGMVWDGSNVANASDRQMIQLPRSPCLLVVNPAAASNFFFSIVGQQGY